MNEIEVFDNLGKQQRVSLMTKIHFESEKARTELERKRFLAELDRGKEFEAEIGLIISLYEWGCNFLERR
ncbi:hypothetical protein J7J62_08995 [bacterium]|nr:hypothetical protein [bacterium]